jgi:hypothetical protein
MGVAIDLACVFLMSCFADASFLFLRSFFSSRRLVVHMAVVNSVANLALCAVNVAMHHKASKHRRTRVEAQRRASDIKTMKTSHGGVQLFPIASHQESALSVVQPSLYGKSHRRHGDGLFTEVQNTEVTNTE